MWACVQKIVVLVTYTGVQYTCCKYVHISVDDVLIVPHPFMSGGYKCLVLKSGIFATVPPGPLEAKHMRKRREERRREKMREEKGEEGKRRNRGR